MVDLYHQDTAKPIGLRKVPKLKYEHINLTSFSKMRVDLATQVQNTWMSVVDTIILTFFNFECR